MSDELVLTEADVTEVIRSRIEVVKHVRAFAEHEQKQALRRQKDAFRRCFWLLKERDPVDDLDIGYNLGLADAIKVLNDDPQMAERLNRLAQAAGERRHP